MFDSDMAVCHTRRRIHACHSSSSCDDLIFDMAAGNSADWCSEPGEGGEGRGGRGGRGGGGGREGDGGGREGVSGGGGRGRGVLPVPRLDVDLCEVDQNQFH